MDRRANQAKSVSENKSCCRNPNGGNGKRIQEFLEALKLFNNFFSWEALVSGFTSKWILLGKEADCFL